VQTLSKFDGIPSIDRDIPKRRGWGKKNKKKLTKGKQMSLLSAKKTTKQRDNNKTKRLDR
jgi:hypothetical protein